MNQELDQALVILTYIVIAVVVIITVVLIKQL